MSKKIRLSTYMLFPILSISSAYAVKEFCGRGLTLAQEKQAIALIKQEQENQRDARVLKRGGYEQPQHSDSPDERSQDFFLSLDCSGVHFSSGNNTRPTNHTTSLQAPMKQDVPFNHVMSRIVRQCHELQNDQDRFEKRMTNTVQSIFQLPGVNNNKKSLMEKAQAIRTERDLGTTGYQIRKNKNLGQ